ncbi:MAG: flagellar biosynthesis protein FlgD [Rhodospirillales bacterium]|jgi:flagellar basal-body rod modification protein FlgD|nr:flagellar biosynthesis protein FlgD [Rhodospirillales bacterium]
MFDPLDISATTGAGQTKSDASKQKLAEDMDQFMNLLVTQLQNQDPLDPMDANEFTSQLVQFAGVEQQIQSNANMEQMLELEKTSLLGNMVGYVGTGVEVTGQILPLINNIAAGSYSLDEKASSSTVTITDSVGKVVYFTAGEVDAGRHEFMWDGTDNFGIPMDDGSYKLTVSALDADGDPVGVGHTVFGVVDSLSMENGIASLNIGDTSYQLEDVLAVTKPF